MGASGWNYEVPYDDDVHAALQRLRQDVFDRGDYEQSWNQFGPDMRAAIAEELAEMGELTGDDLPPGSTERLVETGVPATIDEALTWAMESGTHSILDIAYGVGTEPDFGFVTAMPDATYDELFGTNHPASAAVRAATDAIDSLIHDRWQALYVVGWAGEQPETLFFVGVSGD